MEQTRRKFLRTGLSALVGAGAGATILNVYGSYPAQNLTDAERAFEGFPNTINGMERMQKYQVDGANKTLVHIRQAHNMLNISPEDEFLVNYVQRSIYHILDSLIENKRVGEVYVEGFTPEQKAEIDKLLEDPRVRKFYFGRDELVDKYLNGGAEVLEQEGRLKLVPAETEEGMKRAINGGEKEVLEDREDIALEIISQSPRALDVLIYGGDHRFIDNVVRWNSKNPDKKYSLIEITPEGYGAYE